MAEEKGKPSQKESEAIKYVALATLGGLGAYAIYRLITAGAVAAPCTPGETKCIGYHLYTCNAEGNKWELTESNSPECGYEPDIWFRDNKGLARKAFSLVIVEAGWARADEPLGEKEFSLAVVEAGWAEDDEPLGEKEFNLAVIDIGWVADNKAMGRKDFSLTVLPFGPM